METLFRPTRPHFARVSFRRCPGGTPRPSDPHPPETEVVPRAPGSIRHLPSTFPMTPNSFRSGSSHRPYGRFAQSPGFGYRTAVRWPDPHRPEESTLPKNRHIQPGDKESLRPGSSCKPTPRSPEVVARRAGFPLHASRQALRRFPKTGTFSTRPSPPQSIVLSLYLPFEIDPRTAQGNTACTIHVPCLDFQ